MVMYMSFYHISFQNAIVFSKKEKKKRNLCIFIFFAKNEDAVPPPTEAVPQHRKHAKSAWMYLQKRMDMLVKRGGKKGVAKKGKI